VTPVQAVQPTRGAGSPGGGSGGGARAQADGGAPESPAVPVRASEVPLDVPTTSGAPSAPETAQGSAKGLAALLARLAQLLARVPGEGALPAAVGAQRPAQAARGAAGVPLHLPAVLDGLLGRVLGGGPRAAASGEPGGERAVGETPVDRPTRGRQLAELATALERAAGARPELAALRAALGAQSFRPGAGGGELRALVRVAGPESSTPPPLSRPEAVAQVARALEAELRLAPLAGAALDGGAQPALPRAPAVLAGALGEALEALARQLPEAWTAESVAHTTRALEQQLARALRSRAGAGDARAPEARAWLARLEAPRPEPVLAGREGAVARALAAVAHEQHAAEPSARTRAPADLRALLAATLAELGTGSLRESVARAAQGVDVERLLGRLRLESEGELHVSLPVPDGAGWAPLEVFLGRRDTGRHGTDPGPSREAEADDAWRVVVGVDFSQLGPVRADLWMRPEHVALRLAAERPGTAQALRRLAPSLEELLGAVGRDVRVAVVEAPRGEARVERRAHELRLLRDNPLMDVRG
jgi:hypothetical protein